MVLFPKSEIGRRCTILFLDWCQGKISKADFDFQLNLIRQLIEDKQIPLEFEVEEVKS